MIAYKLRDWINQDKLNWAELCSNPLAIDLLKMNQAKIDWELLGSNPNSIELHKFNLDNIHWYSYARNENPEVLKLLERHWTSQELAKDKYFVDGLIGNPSAAHIIIDHLDYIFDNHYPNNDSDEDEYDEWMLATADLSSNPNPLIINYLKQHPDQIHWRSMSRNPMALELIQANLNKISWLDLSCNKAAIHLLEANPNKINFNWLSINQFAIHLLEANLDKVNWYTLSRNPAAIHLLEANLDKINWSYLSANSAAIDLLEANQEEIDWKRLSANPAIFTYDYQQMKANKEQLHQELMREMYHPIRIKKFLQTGRELEEYLQ